MEIKLFFKNGGRILKDTVKAFSKDNGTKLSAALSYYTIFSLPPLLIVIISLASFFFGAEAVNGQLFGQIQGFVGNASALQIQEIIKSVKFSNDNLIATIIGVSTLIIGASGVFAEVQDSINLIWGLKAKPRKGYIRYIINRLLSFSMVGTMGFLLMVSLIVSAVMDVLNTKLTESFPKITVYFFYILDVATVFVIITLMFAFIFKTLPDARLGWRDSILGAAFTAILFMIGKLVISLYLSRSSVASAYGAAGTVIIVLIWVYYSAIILYFGAEFTKISALARGKKIIPNDYSVKLVTSEIEVNPLGQIEKSNK